MKKRLLITSIVMMLVVAVALSTATYAWFTSNTSVTANTITMTAATSEESSLGIGWINTSTPAAQGAGTVITAAAAAASYNPMVPTDLTVDTAVSTQLFRTATIKQENSTEKFNNDVATIAPYTFNGGENLNAFYVKNLSGTNSVANVKVTAQITPKYTVYSGEVTTATANTYYTLNDGVYTLVAAETEKGENTWYTMDKNGVALVRVAIFARAASTGLNTGNFVLKGVLSYDPQSNDTYYGDANKVKYNENISALDKTSSESYIDLGGLDANQQFDIVALVWLDGNALTDAHAGEVANVGLTFAAAAAGSGS